MSKTRAQSTRAARRSARQAAVLCLVAASTALPLAACAKRAQPERHLIPAGFMGEVVIVHSHPDGVPVREEGDFRVFDIPPSGVLRSRAPAPSGQWRGDELQFFFVEPDGMRVPIPRAAHGLHDTPEARADPTVSMWFLGSGGGSVTDTHCEIEFTKYAIGTQTHMLDHYAGFDLRALLAAHPELCR